MTKPRVILLHGWTMRGSVFGGLMDRISDRVDCIAPDLPGHGEATHLPPTLDAAAALVGEVIAVDPRPPVVVGWSMGATIAWRYIAQQGAEELAGLITVDMSPKIAPSDTWSYGLKNQTKTGLIDTTERMTSDWVGSAHAIAATMFAKGTDPRPFGQAEALVQILSEDPDKLRAMWADLMAADARDVVRRVSCPWLIAYGARSKVYGEEVAQWLHAQAPNAQLVRFENAGHSAHLEDPDAFADALMTFIDQL